MGALRTLLARGVGTVAADLREDRRLRYLLVGAALLCGFWFWHRVPNFATRDEHSRLLDVLVAYGSVAADPSVESLQRGVAWGRVPFGATFYLFGLAVLPVVLLVVLLGQVEVLTTFATPDPEFGYFPSWQATPAWFWTAALVLVRLVNVLLAVGCVYLTYRVGRVVWDRTAGQLAGLLLTLTFGFLTIAHEGGEDMPALFFVLLALYLLVRYVQAGARWRFFAASAAGGAAIAFKLTAVPVVGLVLAAHVLRARRARDTWAALARPALLVPGALLGAVTIALGFPTLLVGGVEAVAWRLLGNPVARATHQTGPDAPVWWWFLRGYLSGMSLPLFLGSVAGVGATLLRVRRRQATADTVLVLTGLVLWVGLFAGWHDFRVHHLLPTFPLLALLLAGTLVRVHDRRPSLARPAAAALLVTAGLYAAVGVGGYAAMPRDDAVAWLETNAEDGDTVEVYRRHIQDTAVPHGMDVNHVYGWEGGGEEVDRCPEFIQLGYRDLLYLDPATYYRNDAARAAYIEGLVSGEYNYEVAAEFGTRPPGFVPRRPTPGSVVDLLRNGVVPQTDQYADEQELAANQYTLILEQAGDCDRSRLRDSPY
jgi:hypothetical protein